jgi:hypothetical protein
MDIIFTRDGEDEGSFPERHVGSDTPEGVIAKRKISSATDPRQKRLKAEDDDSLPVEYAYLLGSHECLF